MMSKWLDRLEYRFRRYGIDNLMIYITGTMLMIYLVEGLTGVSLSQYLWLGRLSVMRGEVWRLVTFIFVPPVNRFFWVLLELYFYYWIGTSLENTWGRTKFTIFYLFGVIGAIIASMIVGSGTNRYLNLSMFLAFAILAPDMEILLWFILPVKIKYLAYIDVALLLISFISGTWPIRLAIIASLVNLIIFFGDNLLDLLRNYKKYGRQRRNFRKSMKRQRDLYGR